MSNLLAAAIGFSLSLVLLNLLLLLRQPQRGATVMLFAAFLVSVLAYLLLPTLEGTSIKLVAVTLQTAAPGTFWLLTASIFDDRFRWRAWQLGLVGFTVLMPLVGRLLSAAQWPGLFFALPQAMEFVMLGLTLWVVVRHWRTDLVERRRRLRLWFVGVNGSYLLVLILSREVLFPGAPWLQLLEYLPPAVLLLLVSAALLRFRGDLIPAAGHRAPDGALLAGSAPDRPQQTSPPPEPEPAEATPASPASTAPDAELVMRLQTHMDEAQPWREMGLGIGRLAEQIGVPEYRLRQAINGHLGHRNFNDFLNRYRIRETKTRLADPKQARLPVLTIAMDAGFRSLSAFNRAFKETQGMTPTAWRKSALPGNPGPAGKIDQKAANSR